MGGDVRMEGRGGIGGLGADVMTTTTRKGGRRMTKRQYTI